MKRSDFIAGIAFFLMLLALTGQASADLISVPLQEQANLFENHIEMSSVLPVQVLPILPSSQPELMKTMAAAETPADNAAAQPTPPQKISDSSVAPAESTPAVKGSDPAAGAPPPSGTVQAAAAPPEKDKPLLNDDSYSSNQTALKAIGKSVDLFKDRIKERFAVYLERSAQYIEIMKEILREKKLPEELVFLPIVESGFNPNAYSRARAVGPWQFIASTGKRYGLIIDWWRDERKDPVKSTVAAAEYLKDLYKIFGSWNLALAAYNAGEGKISKALRRSDSDDYWSLLGTKQIRNETKEYVPRYIAAAMIANTPEEYGFNNLDYHEPLEYDEISISSPLDVEVIAKCAECTVKEIRELNPELRRWSTPPNVDKYTIRIPAGGKDIFMQNLAAIPKKEQFTVEQYTLKKGDTLKKIAKKTGVPGSTIVAMNSLSGLEHLSAGSSIALPPKGKFSPDQDDRAMIRKVSYKKKTANRHSGKKGTKIAKKNKKSLSKRIAKAKSKGKMKSNRA